MAYLAATLVSVLSSSACASAEDPLRDSDSDASASAESIPRGLAEDNGSRDAITVPAGIDLMMYPYCLHVCTPAKQTTEVALRNSVLQDD